MLLPIRSTMLTAALAAVTPMLTSAQTCATVHDLNTSGNPPSSIKFDSGSAANTANVPGSAELVESGGYWYFRASSSAAGLELWRTDGTAQGTFLVGDTVEGTDTGAPHHLTDLNGELLFFSSSYDTTYLWKVGAGATTATNITSLSPSDDFQPVAKPLALGNQLLFVAETPSTGYELWATDGTTAGTHLLKDTNPGGGAGYPHALTLNAAGDKALFLAGGASTSYGLWETDGTSAGTQQLYDFDAPGVPYHLDSADSMAVYGGKFYFEGRGNFTGKGLWKTDGTTAGTKLVRSFGTAASTHLRFNESTEVNGKLFFVTQMAVTGSEIWQTNGTNPGTFAIDQPNPNGFNSGSSNLVEFGGKLIFVAQKTIGSNPTGYELWQYENNTLSLLFESIPGPVSGIDPDTAQLLVSQGKLFFNATTPAGGTELHSIDANFGPAQLLLDLEPGTEASYPTHLTSLSPSTFMFVTDQPNAKRSFWTSDGTALGTQLMYDFAPIYYTQDSYPHGFTAMNGQSTLFLATVGGAVRLHRYDTQSGASIVSSDFLNMPVATGLLERAWVGNRLLVFFHGTSPNQGSGLWVSDGTEAGTQLLQSLDTNNAEAGHGNNNRFFFQGSVLPGSPAQLFITDGTPAGTQALGAVEPRLDSDMASIGDLTYFARQVGPNQDELWVTDGTVAGTNVVQDFGAQANAFKLADLTALGDQLAFSAKGQSANFGLWRSDGTATGTVKVSDRIPDLIDTSEPPFLAWNGMLFFSAKDNLHGRELWRTDLTSAGTILLADVRIGPAYGNPRALVVGAGGVLFLATDGTFFGTNVWRSDGTPAGTALYAAAKLHQASGAELVPAADGVYFEAYNSSGAPSIHFANAVIPPTEICTISTSYLSYGPSEIAWVGGQLLFGYSDPALGYELHSLPIAHAKTLDLGISGSGAQLAASAPSLGTNMTVTCEATPLGSFGALAYSAPIPSPLFSLTQPGSATWLDFSTANLLATFSGPSFTSSFPIPATPSLAGLQINMQAWFFGPGLFPAATSNGLALRLGN